jgi:hypothetical protein
LSSTQHTKGAKGPCLVLTTLVRTRDILYLFLSICMYLHRTSTNHNRRRLYHFSRRHHRRPSWTCACGNCASCRPSSRCAWPTAWPTSSCHPSWRRPSCAKNVSWAPWFRRLETTNARQFLRTGKSGENNAIPQNRTPGTPNQQIEPGIYKKLRLQTKHV